MSDLRIRRLDAIDEISAQRWDALVGEDDPFVEHAFLWTLEESGSVGRAAGWRPVHMTVWEGARLVGALPLYLKNHSYGEYIFDWGWADAAQRIGVSYYPKLVAMVPLTPATGRRFLFADGVDREAVMRRLIDGCFEALDDLDASSLHLNFLADEEMEWVRRDGRLMRRLSFQFHWHNDGYADFDDFLSRFRSSSRKKIRRERRAVRDAGLEVRVLKGSELTHSDWTLLDALYRDTCWRKGSHPYLTKEFFELAPERLRERAVVAMGYREGEAIAATLNFEKGENLYGRYWGASEDQQMLHFELCYYSLIECAIERGLRRFEAGAQGAHKLSRGLMPSPVHSAHFVADPRLRGAVESFLPREAMQVQRHMLELAERGPFRRDQ